MFKTLLPLIALACAALRVQAALSVLEPNSGTVWYKNGTVTLNWTSSDPTADTYLFRVNLRNADQSVLGGDFALADSVNATSNQVTIKLPGVAAAKGYTVLFINTTAPNAVLATSEQFEIADGTVASASASASRATNSASSTSRDIPNAQTSSATAFPTTQPSGAALRQGGLAEQPFLVPGLAALAAVIGGVVTFF